MRRGTVLVGLVGFAAIAVAGLSSCGGAPPKPVSLQRTFTLLDEEGRKAGSVVLSPLGGGELRDSDGTLLGIIAAPGKAAPPAGADAVPAAAPSPEKAQ